MKRIPDGFTPIDQAGWISEDARQILKKNNIQTVEEVLAIQSIPQVQHLLEDVTGPIPVSLGNTALTASPLLAPVPDAELKQFRFAAKKPPERIRQEAEQPKQGHGEFFLAPIAVEKVNLIPGMFEIQSQGNRGACVAFGTTAMVEYIEGKQEKLSEQFLYWTAKMLDGYEDEEGTWIKFAIKGLEEYGICTATHWPYNPEVGDTVHQGPPLARAKSNAEKHKILRSINLNPTSVNDLRNVLAGTETMTARVISFAIPVYNSWLRNPITYKTGRIGMPLPNEQAVGGHCMTLVGFEDDPQWPGGGFFILRNSWGTRWAAESPFGAGYGVLPYEFMAQHGWEAWTAETDVNARIKNHADKASNNIILGRSKKKQQEYGNKGLMFLGTQRTAFGDAMDSQTKKMYVDMMFPHIIFVSGKRGSGKSYTLGVIAEELVRSGLDIGVILIDPVGVFWSLKYPNKNDSEIQALRAMDMQPQGLKNVRVLAPVGVYKTHKTSEMDGEFSLRVADLTADDWCMVFGINRFGTQGLLLEKAIKDVTNGYVAMREDKKLDMPAVDSFNLGNLIQCINESIEITSTDKGFTRETRRSVAARLYGAAGWGVFSRRGTSLTEVIKPGFITVLDFSHPAFDDTLKALLAGIMAKKVLSRRILQTSYQDKALNNDDLQADEAEKIPVTWLLVDEAHLLVPRSHATPASEALINYAKLGRKPGCAMVLATQRPAATNDEVLSQVDIMLGHTLALEDDIRALFKRMPAKVSPEMGSVNFIRGLQTGIALIGDQQASGGALLVRIRPRVTHHAGGEAKPDEK